MNVTFDTAKMAFEKGYPRPKHIDAQSYFHYKGEYEEASNDFENIGQYARPTQAELQTWLRDVHSIHLTAIHRRGVFTNHGQSYDYLLEGTDVIYRKFETWEEALEVGLVEALKLVKI